MNISCFFNPLACFGNGLEILFVSFFCLICKSCVIQSVLSLADTLATFFAFEVFPVVGLLPIRGKGLLRQRDYITVDLFSQEDNAIFVRWWEESGTSSGRCRNKCVPSLCGLVWKNAPFALQRIFFEKQGR